MESTSAPALADPTSFGLDSPARNKALLETLRKKPSKLLARIGLGTGEKLSLLKSGAGNGSIYAEYNGYIALHIQYHQYRYSFLPITSVTQTKLWRSEALPVTNSFSQSLFFRIMLNVSDAMLSDKEHTPDGIDFWKRRAREAMQKNLNVALVDFGNKTYHRFTDKMELEASLTDSWGGGMNKTRYQQMRWLIWRNSK